MTESTNFVPPTDRDMTGDERRQFVRAHRTAIFGYARKQDGPAMTVVYYLVRGDELLVSTMAPRGKAKAVRRNPKVSLCVLDEQWPPTYLQVYCDAVVDTDPEFVTDVVMGIAELMAGEPIDPGLRPKAMKAAAREERVVLRCRPYATFATPPRHLHRAADAPKGLTHWVSQSVAWDAP